RRGRRPRSSPRPSRTIRARCSPPPSTWKRRRPAWSPNSIEPGAMAMTDDVTPDALADAAADVTVSPPKVLGGGFHRLERFALSLPLPTAETIDSVRDVLHVGKVTAVLPIDPARGELVLIRQFRLPAHLATGAGELTEIVAGHVEAGETPAQAGMRECVEGIGGRPSGPSEIFPFIPGPRPRGQHGLPFLGLVCRARVS